MTVCFDVVLMLICILNVEETGRLQVSQDLQGVAQFNDYLQEKLQKKQAELDNVKQELGNVKQSEEKLKEWFTAQIIKIQTASKDDRLKCVNECNARMVSFVNYFRSQHEAAINGHVDDCEVPDKSIPVHSGNHMNII